MPGIGMPKFDVCDDIQFPAFELADNYFDDLLVQFEFFIT